MNLTKVIGFVLLVVGAVLLFFGVQATGTIGEKITDGFTGQYSDHTMRYLISGAAAGAAGVGVLLFGSRR